MLSSSLTAFKKSLNVQSFIEKIAETRNLTIPLSIFFFNLISKHLHHLRNAIIEMLISKFPKKKSF